MARTAPTPLTRTESKARTRAAVLDAARQVFAARGYAEASVDAVAAAAGFTKGAVYAHFDSKQALFLEVLAIGTRNNENILDALLAEAEERPEVLRREFSAWLDSFDRDNSLALLGVELVLESRRSPEVAAVFEEIRARHVAIIGALLAHLYAVEGRPPPMPVALLADTLIALLFGLSLRQIAGDPAQFPSTGAAMRALLGLEPAA